MRKSIKIIGSIIGIIIGIIVAIGLVMGIYLYSTLDSITVPNQDQVEQGPAAYPTIPGINHILLVGVDSINTDIATRSDAMMLLTLDAIHDNVKLTSFARDAYVNIPGIGYEKLTHAYAYGGAPLLLQTVEDNFEIEVDRYVIIDFKSFIIVVDFLGGVEANLEEIDLREFNRVAEENYRKYYDNTEEPFQPIETPGIYNLNGYQTLAYVRMRKTDSIYAREERQREVVEQVFKKVTRMPFTSYSTLLKEVLGYIKTNMSVMEIVKFAFTALQIGTDDVRQLEFPDPDTSEGGVIPGKGWVLQWDEPSGREALHAFLYEE